MEVFKGFKFDMFFKPVVYLSGIILIISIFVPTIYISNYKAQILSFIGFTYGIVAWLIEQNRNPQDRYKFNMFEAQLVLFVIFVMAFTYFAYTTK